MKIDMHVHVTPEDIIKNYQKIGEQEAYFNLLSNTPHNRFATAAQVLLDMKETGFDKSVIFGFSFSDMTLCKYVNDYVIEQVKQHPKELIGFISVVPQHPQAVAEIERCYAKGLRGIGELFPVGQGIDLTSRKATDDFAQCCIQYQLPVIIHVNEPVGHDYAGKTTTSLKEVETFVSHYPELNIILAHFGGGLWQYELMKEVKSKFQKVYYDNAAGIFLYEPQIYKVMVQMGLLDKMLFGSDFPLLSPRRYEKSLLESGLSKEELKKILGGNAMQLFENLNSKNVDNYLEVE